MHTTKVLVLLSTLLSFVGSVLLFQNFDYASAISVKDQRNVLYYIDPKLHTAIKNGTNVQDLSKELEKAFNSAQGTLFFPEGTYVSGPIEIKKPVRVVGINARLLLK